MAATLCVASPLTSRLNQPNPAIVAQDAVRRLPRWALLLLCLAYVVPGYVGREPWKNADIAAFGYMLELAKSSDLAFWLKPTLMGQPADAGALLPYWLGALAIQLAPSWMPAELAVRLPFVAMLAMTLAGTWYAVYYLARQSSQRVRSGAMRQRQRSKVLLSTSVTASASTSTQTNRRRTRGSVRVSPGVRRASRTMLP